VHGVSIDCLRSLSAALDGLLNRPQTRQVTIKGRRVRNLALRAESETMLLDQLILSFNEIGHMSFLRAERILNLHLGKNNIRSSPHFEYLRAQLRKASYLVPENKLLSSPSSADTILLQDYRHDIYVHEGSAHVRFTAMLANLRRILRVELMAALEVIFDMYAKEDSLFLNREMEEAYLQLVGIRSEDSLQYGAGIEEWLN
jgi:histidine ammonia-lyase